MSLAEKFLNLDKVREKLGVKHRQWTMCSMVVHAFLMGDWNVNLADKITTVLEKGVQVLVYSGDKDYICNWRGGEAWTNALEWSKKEEFNNQNYKEWIVDGKTAG
jgi:cathepsin A (carboxypeptidase C)